MSTTQGLFDQIAPGWYGFRHRTIFRSELETLAKRWRAGRLLNIGCAHGPDFVPFKDAFQLYGIDLSGEMLKLAQKYARKFDFEVSLAQADARALPFPDESFDFAIAVAAYHHIKGHNEQRQALRELRRVMKPDGEAFITVWNRWQPRFWFKGKEVLVPWRMRDQTLSRYYYLFTYGELERLVRAVGLDVVRSFPEHSYKLPIKLFSRNICLVVRRHTLSSHV